MLNKLCAGLLLACALGLGQTHTVTVRGVVKDSSGGVVRNAAVSVANIDQGRHWDTRTADFGEYVLVQIPPECRPKHQDWRAAAKATESSEVHRRAPGLAAYGLAYCPVTVKVVFTVSPLAAEI